MEDVVVSEFERQKKQLGGIKWGEGILWPSNYVEKWRILLWDKAFYPLIRAQRPFTKGTKLEAFKFGEIAIKRVFYKYL